MGILIPIILLVKYILSQKMTYLNLDLAKKHLNIDDCYHDDDAYIKMLCDVAEERVAEHLDNKLDNIVENNNGSLPKPILHAMLLLIGNFYMMRESITSGQWNELPLSVSYLLSTYKNYDNSAL